MVGGDKIRKEEKGGLRGKSDGGLKGRQEVRGDLKRCCSSENELD